MALCVSVTRKNVLKATNKHVDNCHSYVLVTATEYKANTETIAFNGDLFLYVSGVLLINMVVGHWVGRVVRILNKR
ncbi:hypothetical protein [Vibrio rotiferianus]|jgi:hypothetical protein|uniref:hypothetical protein n=1 Tax=Vibrio rotiferianus TaxID=190895 RepID=UPI0011105445|nr:hypothetical protein [Vibrio rotiferianus]NOH69435.1 hypothetical protein [Vibrio rotiferianus]TMX55904.1 hypothetical protein DA097_24375 [Vibrio rotiferianus]TMX62383.1 hypothetical protein DA097_15570 [Vibrio rotiferianus]TMX73237.1 hypothetical protein DA097_01620 [Vibrio rotiferianus]CAH1536336.1 conserved hypothetical protein [Vibrio rotiferianus]